MSSQCLLIIIPSQWEIFPQRMSKSPTLCQYFVKHNQISQSIIYHYLDDILLADSDSDALEKRFEEEKKILSC